MCEEMICDPEYEIKIDSVKDTSGTNWWIRHVNSDWDEYHETLSKLNFMDDRR